MIAVSLLLLASLQQPLIDFGVETEFPPKRKLSRFCWDIAPCGEKATGATIWIAGPEQDWQEWVTVHHSIQDILDGRGCWTIDVLQFPPGLVFVVITTWNAAGHSVTEHGSWAGEKYEPVEACP